MCKLSHAFKSDLYRKQTFCFFKGWLNKNQEMLSKGAFSVLSQQLKLKDRMFMLPKLKIVTPQQSKSSPGEFPDTCSPEITLTKSLKGHSICHCQRMRKRRSISSGDQSVCPGKMKILPLKCFISYRFEFLPLKQHNRTSKKLETYSPEGIVLTTAPLTLLMYLLHILQ